MSQKNFTNATGNWIVSDTGEISYTGTVKVEGDLQSNDFLDADGNSIIRPDIWVVSDPNEFGQKTVKFSDQLYNPDDVNDFFIRYSTDPEQGSMSRATINAYRLYGKYIEASSSIKATDIIASDSVESPKVTAELVQSISATSTKQEVLGSIVIGKIEETASFSEEQKAAAMGLQSAFKVVKPSPMPPIPDTVMVDIDKNGNITAKGVVQATDYLDADGNSIIRGEVDLSGYLKSEDDYLVTTSRPLHMVTWTTDDTYDGFSGVFNISWERKSYDDYYAAIRGNCLQGSEGIGIYSGKDGNYAAQHATPFGIAVTVASKQAQFLVPEIVLAGEYGSTSDQYVAVKMPRDGNAFFKYAVQAADFLDADGNSIIGDNDLDWVNNDEDNSAIVLGWDNIPDPRGNGQVLIGTGVAGKAESVAIGHNADADSSGFAAGFYAKAGYEGIAIGEEANSGTNGIALGRDARAGSREFAIGGDIRTVNFSGATVQAKDFLDANGNQLPKSATVNNFVTLTQTQYDSLSPKDASTIYFIKE